MSPSPYRPLGFTPPRPWAPMSDPEWGALLPYVARRAPQGRPVAGRPVAGRTGDGMADLRARMDAIFHMACRGYHVPWREVPEVYGRPDTVSRFFRRLTHGGLWHALLKSLADATLWEEHPLRRLEHFIVRACRCAARLGGLRLLFLIKRLGRLSALNAPAWLLPDRDLSELVPLVAARHHSRTPGEPWAAFRARSRLVTRDLKRLHRMAAGRARIPRAMRLIWP